MKEFTPQWYTIPAFEKMSPICVYHKENEPGPKQPGSDKKSPSEADIKNLHVLARSSLTYTKETGQVWIWITADDYYKLYVNGKFAGQGPAPAYPEKYYYNEINLTPYLEEGQNILAVHLYYQGLINRVWNSGDGRFGLACGILEESSPAREPVWKYCVSKAYSGETTGYETQYLENFDSRLWQEDWNAKNFDDSSWDKMVPACWADYVLCRQPVKMLDIYTIEPEEIKRENGVWKIDFGREITGALNIQAFGKAGDRIIIRCGEECSRDGSVRFDMRCNCRYEEIWTLKEGECRYEPYDYKGFRYAELRIENGEETDKDCFLHKNSKYENSMHERCMYEDSMHKGCMHEKSMHKGCMHEDSVYKSSMHKSSKHESFILDVKAAVRHYPMKEELCTVTSSEKYLEDIFNICKNAVKCGTQEGYLDCPTREKGQYLGDAFVTAHSQVWLTGSVEMLRKCIDQYAQTSQICPGLMAVAPGSFMQEIADFSLLWPQMLLMDYRFTGDRQFLGTYYPKARGVLAYFESYARGDGLIESVSEKWNLTDWPENLRDGYDFTLSRPHVAQGCHNVINALYIGAVKAVSKMEKILGKRPSYDFDRLQKAYIKAFYCPQKKLFCDSEHSTHTAIHSNLYALYFGLAPLESEKRISDFLLEKGLCCGVLLSYFYLKALARSGRYQDVYRMMVNETEHGWVNMIREGASACFETWGKEQKWNTSLCHPWASAPVPVLIEDIAGLVPDPDCAGGFRFEPHVPDEIGELEVKVFFRGTAYTVRREAGGCFLHKF